MILEWGCKMSEPVLLFSGILLASTFFSSLSQVMLKKAAMREHASLAKEYLNPLVICAYLIFFGCTLLTVYALRVVPLGLGAILETTGYIFVAVLSFLFLKERLDVKKICSLALIVGGIAVYAFFG